MCDHRDSAERYLRTYLGESGCFREGQWEAIDALLKGQRLLVVQRTGWGKSLIYFLTTRLLRDRGAGPTLIISPLIALMRDQILAAERIGVIADSIHSDVPRQKWENIRIRFVNGQIHVLLISPERLARRDFRDEFLAPLVGGIGLLVVDEAHCVSDWGHDFRPDYQHIARFLTTMPREMPFLATTATANAQAVTDIRNQFGAEIQIQRGPLDRESLHLQAMSFQNPAEKMAWLKKHFPELRRLGTGIIYALTIRSATRVAEWLRRCGFRTEVYHGQMEGEVRRELEERLLNNTVDALVATSALGMGYDKPDLGFVVHFQIPGSVVHYYQHVGRAGRQLPRAYGILLNSPDDDEVIDYFIENAFPPADQVEQLLSIVRGLRTGTNLTMPRLESLINLSHTRLIHALRLLSLQESSAIEADGQGWRVTGDPGSIEQYRHTEQRRLVVRRREQEQMQEYVRCSKCLMAYLKNALDDSESDVCGRCAVCKGELLVPCDDITESDVQEARAFFRGCVSDLNIEPRKKWPAYQPLSGYHWDGNIRADLQACQGRALSVWNDPGWGRLVSQGYQKGSYDLELQEPLIRLFREWNPSPAPRWITCVPSSTHPGAIPELARRLADALGLPFYACVRKSRDTAPQQTMANSWQRTHNLDCAFQINARPSCFGEAVLLLDDVVETRWTFTVVAALLREKGCGPVFPIALAQHR